MKIDSCHGEADARNLRKLAGTAWNWLRTITVNSLRQKLRRLGTTGTAAPGSGPRGSAKEMRQRLHTGGLDVPRSEFK